MHKGFNLQLKSTPEWLKWKADGDVLFANSKGSRRKALESYVKAGVVDGGKLQSHWFEQKKANVFISHSHKDENLAIALAGWLYRTFGLLAFVDSCVWGYANDLQRQLDNAYCKDTEKATTYSYAKRNRTTSHVHMMLSTALIDMMDRTECFIFLHTNESIVQNSVETSLNHPTTTSPWIYAELAASRMLREQETGRPRVLKRAVEAYAMDGIIQYPAHLSHLNPLNDGALRTWEGRKIQGPAALDKLYELFG